MSILDSFGSDVRAVVIGASGGIGSALVEQLAQASNVADIIALSRSGTDFSAPNITQGFIDITDESSIADAATRATTVDLVIVATGALHDEHGMAPEKSLRALNMEQLQRSFAINAIAPALIAKHFLPLLPRDRKSAFAAISARVSSISDNQLGGWYGYRASKTALNMMLKNAAIETARRNKQAVILGLHPGTVNTGLSKPYQGQISHDVFTPEESARYLLSVINSKNGQDSGKLFAWDGAEIPF